MRERPDDIPALLDHFLFYFSRELGKPAPKISHDLVIKLSGYPWPGNIRELKNAVERAVVLSRGPQLREADFPLLRPAASAPGETLFTPVPLQSAMDRFKQQYIQEVLSRCGGNQTRAAEILQIQRTYLNRLLHQKLDNSRQPPKK